jgi:hypothetical protein
MSWKSVATAAVVTGAIGFAAGRVYSQDDKGKMPNADEMKKMMEEMAKPVEQHKQLASQAGTWDVEMTMFEPGKDPKKEKGVVKSSSILNGLYLWSEHSSEMDGKAFEGRGVDGYSKEKKKYFTYWFDSMGSTPMLLWGDADASGKTITYDGEVYDLGAMGTMTPRTKVVHEDADHMTFEFWSKMGGASDYVKMMEGKYTRRR